MNYSFELSKFDTEILGFKTAKILNIESIKDEKSNIEIINKLKEDLHSKGIVYATYRLDANKYNLIINLQRCGFIVIDGIITLEKSLDSVDVSQNSNIVRAEESDLEQLVNISKTVFTGVSRYYRDPAIPKQKANLIYETWTKNSLNKQVADMVLAWKEKEEILGFITLQKNGQIPLLGVSEKSRGKGVGKGLVLEGLKVFKNWGLKKAVIETQITNIAALRLYHSCGFKEVGSFVTLRLYNPD